ncbi:PD-(D/E)XK motif protein [uncultured Acetobacterium sp.]|uniref:PD-(D/E)XK motif protein n=1 Tax=uncultured Acetobacterium sp. TaxID=217139 RepID=UPI0025E9FDFE|nr:PD-(D/E)XK motif protein [uncultured Acetobacterium sp.]
MSLIDYEALINKWDSSRSEEDVLIRVDAEHPLDFFIGKDDAGNRVLALISDYEPSKISSSKSLTVLKNNRAIDGRWAIKIKLVNSEFSDVFLHLCFDLIEACGYAENELNGVEIFVSRFTKWQKMMESGYEEMSVSVIKGLLGELLFIDKILFNKMDRGSAIKAWLGPEGSDRDFVFSETWAEIKTIGVDKDSVAISSLDQLDIPQVGYLGVIRLEKTTASDKDGFSFNGIINMIIKKLELYPSINYIFKNKLLKLGYRNRENYDNMYFVYKGIKFYKVDATFPKLIPENVREEIIKATYSLSLAAIKDWKVEDIDGVRNIS